LIPEAYVHAANPANKNKSIALILGVEFLIYSHFFSLIMGQIRIAIGL